MARSRGRTFVAGLVLFGLAGGWLLLQRRHRPEQSASGRLAPRPSLFAPEPDHDIRTASAAVEGTVLDPDGKPVDGATVVLARGNTRYEPPAFNRPPAVTITAAGGRFRFDGVAAGHYGVTALAEGFIPGRRGPVEVSGDGAIRIEVRLGPGGLLLSGRVLDVGGGVVPRAAVRAVEVVVRPTGNVYLPSTYQVSADESGTYRLWLGSGQYNLTAEADGYAPGHDMVVVARNQTRDLRLTPAARIIGQVVDRGTHQPVPDAEVWLMVHISGSRRPRDVKTDGEGVFAFNDVEAGSYRVGARKGVLVGLGTPVSVAMAQTVTDVMVEVDPGQTVAGRVVSGDDKPVGAARLTMFKSTPPSERSQFARSNPDGTFRIEGVFPGTYRISAMADGYAPSDRSLRVTADVKDLKLVLAEQVVVSGRVVTAEGQPVEGADVSVRVDGTGPGGSISTLSATSGPDGAFEVKPLTPGMATVTAQHTERGVASLPAQKLAAAEKKTVVVRLTAGASVSGTVRVHDRTPVAGARLEAQMNGPSAGRWTASTDADGRYRIGPLPPGRVIIVASRSPGMMWSTDDRPDQKTVSIAAGEQKIDVDLEVPGGNAIRGNVVGSDGKSVAGAEVTAGVERNGEAWRGASHDRAFTDADGAFTLDDLGAGNYTVWAVHPGHADAEAKGVASGTTGLRLRFPAEGTLAGIAVTSDGKPIGDYLITLLPGPAPGETPDQRRRRQMTGNSDTPTDRVHDPSGAFQFRRLRAGTYELRLSTADGRSGNLVTAVHEGESRRDVRLVVETGVRLTGRVVEFDNGTPLADIEVSASVTGGNQTVARTDQAGAFALEGLSPGQTTRVSFTGDRTTHIPDFREMDVPAGRSVVDLGTIKLLRGNGEQAWRDGSNRGIVGMAPTGGAPARILSLMAGSPAEKGGMKPGDEIVSIDGKDVRDLGIGAVMFLMRGRPGSSVTIGLASPGSGARSVTVVRFVPPGNH